MTMLEEKLQSICDKLSLLLVNLKHIYATKISLIPLQIKKIVIGENKLPSLVDGSIQIVNEDDLKYVNSIDAQAFARCRSLTNITIPDSVTAIDTQAFLVCSSLISIIIPDSVTSIGNGAFDGCYNLADIYLNPTTPPSLGSTYAIPNTTTIHVPIDSGDAYKSATNWSYHSDRIVEDIEPS